MTNITPLIFESRADFDASWKKAPSDYGNGSFNDLLVRNGHTGYEDGYTSTGRVTWSDLKGRDTPATTTQAEAEQGVIAEYAGTLGSGSIVVNLIDLEKQPGYAPISRGDGTYAYPIGIDNVADRNTDFNFNVDKDGHSDTPVGYVKENGEFKYLITVEAE